MFPADYRAKAQARQTLGQQRSENEMVMKASLDLVLTFFLPQRGSGEGERLKTMSPSPNTSASRRWTTTAATGECAWRTPHMHLHPLNRPPFLRPPLPALASGPGGPDRSLSVILPPPSLQELELCDADTNVFKLIGPTLIKQDLTEAKANVGKRIDYIGSELCAPT